MDSGRHAKTLTASITAKLTPEEQSLIKQHAKQAGLRPSEWCRRALVSAAGCAAETRLILGELMALRKVFLTIHTEILQDHEPDAHRLKAIVDEAEATKYAMADQRIQKFYSGESAA